MKRRILRLIGNGMAAALDVSIGMLIAALIARAISLDIEPYHLLAGALLALLPDFDIFLPVLKDDVGGLHRETLMHRPALILPLSAIAGAAASYYTGTSFWLFCSIICPLWHYLHDTSGWWFGAGGIAWAWPINDTLYTLKGPWTPPHHEHAAWVEREWLTPSALSSKEIGAGSIASGLAVGTAFGPFEGTTFFLFSLLMTAVVWSLHALPSLESVKDS